jgi:beta-lactamase regulating signal transducer with metallopeptidase domain
MIGWAVGTAISVSLLILLVLVIRGPVARQFGARAAYALWLAPALRAVMPPLPQLPTLPAPAAAADAQYWLVASGASGSSPQSTSAMLLVVWAVGAVALLALHCWRHHRFLHQALATGRPVVADMVPYDVVATPAVDGPAATGLLHPLILVPTDFSRRFTPDQQRFALWHEQLHHRRGDIWASAAALIVTAMLWFNPVAHLALRAFRRDMEAACDERLLSEAGRDAAPAYAETILRCAARPVPRSLCALTSIDELKGRLKMLKLDHGPTRRLTGLLLAGGVAIAGLGLAVPAAADEAPKKQVFTKKIVVHGDRDGGSERDVLERAEGGDFERIGAKCDGEKVELSADGGSADKKQAIKFFICAKKGEGRAELAGALEKAAADLGQEADMDPAIKAELLAKMRAKIESLRAGG